MDLVLHSCISALTHIRCNRPILELILMKRYGSQAIYVIRQKVAQTVRKDYNAQCRCKFGLTQSVQAVCFVCYFSGSWHGCKDRIQYNVNKFNDALPLLFHRQHFDISFFLYINILKYSYFELKLTTLIKIKNVGKIKTLKLLQRVCIKELKKTFI